MKLLVDMNLSPVWVAYLTDSGFDASHWSEIGAPNADDKIIIAHARSHGFVLLTNDLDFSAILAASAGAAPSVVQIRTADLHPDHIGARTVSALRRCTAELASGAVLTVDERRARLRKLPIKS